VSTIELLDGDLAVRLAPWERLVCLRRTDVEVPAGGVVRAFRVEDPWHVLRGVRMPGLGLPGVAALGTWVWRSAHGSGRDFVAVRGHGPGVVLDLTGCAFDRLVLSVDDPSEITSQFLDRG
jgi:hypothetical protein